MIPLELWGGVECTVNRVGDRYHDQLRRNGHASRLSDLDRFASLGVRALRHPVVWERVAPDGLPAADWSFADASLARLRELGIRPIVTLLHHGSGPRDTSLLDPGFPEKLATYARAVAERYPWVEDYTPVNEPLTTARFSALYGHWYPHAKDDASFIRALLHECEGTVRAMREIRAVNPRARLVQTDDTGETFSTERLAYQARLENQRRWLSFDLLAGRVVPEHPLWGWLMHLGADARELDWLAEQPCLPDVIALNYYLTSDRVLDERLHLYPRWSHGGNGRDRYADVEAVRAWPAGIVGHRDLLLRAYRRYGTKVAFGEVHLGCTREEQLRWLVEAWRGCLEARAEGAEVQALTIWSLLGAFDWNRLVTAETGFYEPGVYDVRSSPEPRETALAWAARELGAGRLPDHAVLDRPGFWHRPERIFWGAPAERVEGDVPANEDAQPLVVIGARGTLGAEFGRACALRGITVRLLSRREMDIAVGDSVEAALDSLRPWAVINAAGYVRVDHAESDRVRCERENVFGAAVLARACAARGLPLVTFSSDLVFDGTKRGAYVESDTPRPLCVYGATKAEGERATLAAHPGALVVRTSAFFGPWDDYNFVTVALRELEAGHRFVADAEYVVTPTYVPDLVHTALDLLLDRANGLWHLAGNDAVTWADLARRAARAAELDDRLVVGVPTRMLDLAAVRPPQSALASERGATLGALDEALARYMDARRRNAAELSGSDGGRVACGGGDACPGHGRCRVHR